MRTAANLWAVGSTCENMCKKHFGVRVKETSMHTTKKKKRPSIVVIKAVSTHLLGNFPFQMLEHKNSKDKIHIRHLI